MTGALTWVEGATHTYLIALAIGIGLILVVVGHVERRARRRSDGLGWQDAGS